jgi:uncharacterized membrane protein
MQSCQIILAELPAFTLFRRFSEAVVHWIFQIDFFVESRSFRAFSLEKRRFRQIFTFMAAQLLNQTSGW